VNNASPVAASPVSRLLAMFRPVWPGMALGVVLSAALGIVLLPVPLLFQRIIDLRLPERDLGGLVWDSSLLLGLYVLHLGLLVFSKYLVLKNSKQVIMRLRGDVVMKLQQLSISFYDSEDLGLLHSRIVQDTEKVDVLCNFIPAGPGRPAPAGPPAPAPDPAADRGGWGLLGPAGVLQGPHQEEVQRLARRVRQLQRQGAGPAA
jgi:ABC-type multidrug transport system fused ATPase/permease subunit